MASEVKCDALDAMVELAPLSIGESRELGSATLTRIDADTLQIEGGGTAIQLCRGVVKVLRGNLHLVNPEVGNA